MFPDRGTTYGSWFRTTATITAATYACSKIMEWCGGRLSLNGRDVIVIVAAASSFEFPYPDWIMRGNPFSRDEARIAKKIVPLVTAFGMRQLMPLTASSYRDMFPLAFGFVGIIAIVKLATPYIVERERTADGDE